MRVLVTGADGFIGSHLVEKLLKNNFKVTALCSYNSFSNPGWLNFIYTKKKRNLDVVFGDIRDDRIFDRLLLKNKIILHLAALIGIPYSFEAPKSYVDTNLYGTLNLLNSALRRNINRIILTSTSEVYGSGKYFPIDEKHPLVAQSPYAATKIAADKLALSYFAAFNLPVSIMRPFNAFGPRQSRRAVIPSIIYQALEKKSITLGNINAYRDFNYVEDITDAYLKATKVNINKIKGEEINIGSNYSVSIKQVANMIKKIVKKDIPIKIDKKRFRPNKSEVNKLMGSNKKAKKLLNWKPKYSGTKNFYNGLKKTVEWYKINNNLPIFSKKSYEK
tara:strand:- start:7221 stop:8219 length:999 start_codon:yes stop_codon:yes gene_type:complete